MVAENKKYKVADYLNRSNDRYTLTKYKIVMGWLPEITNIRVLNAGCGSGEMNILLSQNPSWQVDALDVDYEAICLSQKLKEENNITNLTIFHTTIEKHKPEEKYDIIVSNDVLEHIEDDITAIKKLAHMLKPNGIICISVPALQWLFGYHDEMLGHYRRYNKRSLTKKFSLFFEVKRHKCRYFGASLIPIVLLYSCLFRKDYPVSKLNKKSLIRKVLDWIMLLEAEFPFPIGISILLVATNKS